MAQEVKPQEPIRNSNAKGYYDGKELAPFEGRPGAIRGPSWRHGCLQTPIPATREPRLPQMNYEPAAASTLTSVVLGGKKQTVGSPIKD